MSYHPNNWWTKCSYTYLHIIHFTSLSTLLNCVLRKMLILALWSIIGGQERRHKEYHWTIYVNNRKIGGTMLYTLKPFWSQGRNISLSFSEDVSFRRGYQFFDILPDNLKWLQSFKTTICIYCITNCTEYWYNPLQVKPL